MGDKRYVDGVRLNARGYDAYRFSQYKFASIDAANKAANNPHNMYDKRFFDIGLKAAAGKLYVKDIPEFILKKYFSFLGQTVEQDKKIMFEDIPEEVKNHISFNDGVNNWRRQEEAEKVCEAAKDDTFATYDRGFMFGVNGTPANRINKKDLKDPIFMQGYSDAMDFILLNCDEEYIKMFIEGKNWAMKKKEFSDANRICQNNDAFSSGYEFYSLYEKKHILHR